MKGVARWPAGQSLLARLTAGYVELLIATVRWRYDNRAAADLAATAPEGLIALFWHGRIAQGMAPPASRKPESLASRDVGRGVLHRLSCRNCGPRSWS